MCVCVRRLACVHGSLDADVCGRGQPVPNSRDV